MSLPSDIRGQSAAGCQFLPATLVLSGTDSYLAGRHQSVGEEKEGSQEGCAGALVSDLCGCGHEPLISASLSQESAFCQDTGVLAWGIVENLKASQARHMGPLLKSLIATVPPRTLPPFLPVLSRLYQLTEYGLGQFADLGFPRDRGFPTSESHFGDPVTSASQL